MPPEAGPRAWVEVDAGAIKRNLAAVRQAVGAGVRIIAMVKANGYGLGATRVVSALAHGSPFGYGVATVKEGLELRRMGVRDPVMVCSPVVPSELGAAVARGVTPTISDLGSLAVLSDLGHAEEDGGMEIPFQVEVDTGMGRSGFSLDERGWWSEVRLATTRGLRLAGIFTHLHSADAPSDASARVQLGRFEDFVKGAGHIAPETLLHVANSAGCFRIASGLANAVRPGYYLYGGHPGGVLDVDWAPRPSPVMSLRARVAFLRKVARGTTLGYGATYRAGERERWATVTIGYGDGLPRNLGNRGRALVLGERARVVGQVSMDTTVLRTSDAVTVGDIVTFVGRDGQARLDLDDVAGVAGMIGYEFLTGLSSRLPRTVVG